MPAENVTYTPANSMTIGETGVYEIHYMGNLSSTAPASVTLAVRRNGTNIPSATITRQLPANTNSFYNGTTILNLTAGDVITMALSSPSAVSVTHNNGTSATLTVKKID